MSETQNLPRCRCPVCGANQDWSAECRRCSADLKLLRETTVAANNARQGCLHAIAKGRNRTALSFARRLNRIRPDDESKRFLAVCSLLWGDFHLAKSLAKPVDLKHF